MQSRTVNTLLLCSSLLNVLLAAVLVFDRIEHRRMALGKVSRSDAAMSFFSAKLLPRIKFEVRVAQEQPSLGYTQYSVPATGETFYAFGDPVLTNQDIVSASAASGPIGDPTLRLVFTAEGARKIQEATTSHVRKRLLFISDGEVLMAPIIMGPITDRETMISGAFNEEEVKRLALALARR